MDLNTFKQNLKDLFESIDNIVTNLNDANERMDDLDSALDNANSEIDSAEGAVQDAKEQVENAQSEINGAEKAMGRAFDEMDALRTGQETITEALESGLFDANNGKADALLADIDVESQKDYVAMEEVNRMLNDGVNLLHARMQALLETRKRIQALREDRTEE